MENIFDYNLDEIKELLTPSFRAKQIWHWLYAKYENDFNMMINIPKDMRIKLNTKFNAKNLEIKDIQVSSDGTKKYLFETFDNQTFESVLIKMRDKQNDDKGNIISSEKYTICVSSQIGCKIGCRFCRTAEDGFKRNLSAGEIVEQVVAIKKDNNILPQKRVNIVYMGMGEPLDNFDNLIKAIKIISHIDGLSISTRRQTISTSGISPMINALGELNIGVGLAISLHAVNNETRNKLMPINKTYNIESIIESVRNFPIDARKRVMFEYLMIKNINDDLKNAKDLLKLINGINVKINIILFNPYENSKFQRPDIETAKKFVDFLISKGQLATIRESKGIDIDAACGQLKYKKEKLKHKNSFT
ncbi:23S rRNA (adenine(2503)-C(2))-methyltransferase RlmN [Helicobacter sp. MIT 14-3879]|uniref:23S rRNA (adenine(2503)-C(2))-methyltransferase RlmN n=1 Tax=Helicobacter sp. MIT 14-3879 TaxID=2040649 RepID=UPI000E1E8B49|nr:23S rRNA (adenine(2503)-C(2))-methyltransferase RlmN [Helicobacter sp. MIT 14-3879]RDU65055.1 23S rRNA (adenine(2503)-C(2))-methyltransferase RlmN [Helicobacter sp. MIT 14-3879]